MTEVTVSHVYIRSSQYSNVSSPPPHQGLSLPYLWAPDPCLHHAWEITETWQFLRKDSLLRVPWWTPESKVFSNHDPTLFHMKPLCFHQTCPSFPRKRNNESQLSDQDTTFGGSRDASQSHLSFSLRNDWPLPHTSDLTKAFRSYGIIWLQTRRLKRRASFFF